MKKQPKKVVPNMPYIGCRVPESMLREIESIAAGIDPSNPNRGQAMRILIDEALKARKQL